MAHEACGLGGPPTTSIRHMRQLPAIESRSWKQKRGISAPAISHACNSVYSGGTSISVPSTMSLVMSAPVHPKHETRRHNDAERHVDAREESHAIPEFVHRHRPHSAATRTGSGCGFAEYWSIRFSISGVKWRSRPCTGQAAPSPKAQIV